MSQCSIADYRFYAALQRTITRFLLPSPEEKKKKKQHTKLQTFQSS